MLFFNRKCHKIYDRQRKEKINEDLSNYRYIFLDQKFLYM